MSHSRTRVLLAVALVGTACPGDDGGSTSSTSVADTATSSASSTSGADAPTGEASDAASSSGAIDSSTGMNDSGGSSTSSGSATETGAAGPTWESFAAGFFETYCWECHGPGDALRDYSMLSAVMMEATTIRCGTAPVGAMLSGCEGEPPAGQFPIGDNLPTDDERTTLVEWIDAGLPES